jgi:nitroreductase
MDLEHVIRERYSCRKFLLEPVPHRIIEKILDLAQQTPSWCNCQPWQIVLVTGGAVASFRDVLLAHAAGGHPSQPDFPFPLRFEGIYRERRKVCGVQLYQSLGIGRENREGVERQRLENFRFFEAPHVALITTEEELGVYGAVDCGLYVANFILAAKNFGVDSIAQAALASYPDLIRSRFGLPANRKLICGISFGYADAEHPIHQYRTERAAVAEVATWIE